MDPGREFQLMLTRRQLFGKMATGIGTAALGSLLSPEVLAAVTGGKVANPLQTHGALKQLHFVPKAKRVRFLTFMTGRQPR